MYSRQALLTHTGLPEARTPLYYCIALKGKNPNKHIVLGKKNLQYTGLNRVSWGKWSKSLSLIVLAAAWVWTYTSSGLCLDHNHDTEPLQARQELKPGLSHIPCKPTPDAKMRLWLSKARQGQRMLSSLKSTSRAISKLHRYYLKNTTCLGAFHSPLLTRKNVDLRKGFPQAPQKGRKRECTAI